MTGGEPITARFLRQNYFQFKPVLKLWFRGNDRAELGGAPPGFWRRVRAFRSL